MSKKITSKFSSFKMKKSYQSFVHDLLNSDILVPYFFVDAFDFSTRNFNNLIYSKMRVVRF